MTAPASAAAAAASASSLPPDSRPGTGTGTGTTTTGTGTASSSLRRFGRLPSNSNSNSHSSSASPYLSSTHRPNRNPLASRFPRFAAASSNSPDLSSAGGSLPIPCAPTEQPSTISRYRQAFFGCYRDIGVDLQASSPESMVSVHSDDSEAEGDTQGTMARLRRQRTSSQTSQAPDPSHRSDAREPPRASNRSSSSRPRSSSNRPEASPVPPDPTSAVNTASPENTSTPENTSRPNKKATIRFYPHQDFHRNTRPSLHFIPVSRTLPSDNCVIRVGRYSERDGAPVANPAGPSGAPVGFKSKVVSRRHCEFLYINAQWHVKDVGSSSGTFLNHMRLSQPNMASRLYPIKDGDIVQLGIDFRGGEEMIFRCVRMRIECNRSWQQQPNEFNKNTESLIKNLGKGDTAEYSGCRECSICLGSVLRPYQCLFMAACAHVWHYKCVSPLIHSPEYPMFQCPNCRAYTDLSADVDDSNDFDNQEQKDSEHGEQMTPEEGEEGEQEEQRAETEESQIEPEAPGPEEGAQQSAAEVSPTGREAHESGSEASRSEPEESRPASHEDQHEAQSPRETPNTSDGSEDTPAPAAPPTSVPLSHPIQMDPLSSPSLEEALAINFDGLDLGTSMTGTETGEAGDLNPPDPASTNGDIPRSDNLDVPGMPPANRPTDTVQARQMREGLETPDTASANGDVPRSDNLDVPGQQSANRPMSAVHARQMREGLDTPTRSDSSEDNPLTPRNDSGPLALDGRAGMQ